MFGRFFNKKLHKTDINTPLIAPMAHYELPSPYDPYAVQKAMHSAKSYLDGLTGVASVEGTVGLDLKFCTIFMGFEQEKDSLRKITRHLAHNSRYFEWTRDCVEDFLYGVIDANPDVQVVINVPFESGPVMAYHSAVSLYNGMDRVLKDLGFKDGATG